MSDSELQEVADAMRARFRDVRPVHAYMTLAGGAYPVIERQVRKRVAAELETGAALYEIDGNQVKADALRTEAELLVCP